MKKNIKVSESVSFDIDTSNAWLFEYRQQFGHDIVPDLLPAVQAVFEIVSGAVEGLEGKRATVANVISGMYQNEAVNEAFISLAGLEMITLFQVTWAMAKVADPSIPEVRDWVQSFETFPIDVIAPQVLDAITRSILSEKNASRLQEMLWSLLPSPSKE